MDKLSEMKLAIYERRNQGEITQEECNLLLEKAEEKYSFKSSLTEDEQIAVECVMEGFMDFDEATDVLCEGVEKIDKSLQKNKIMLDTLGKLNQEYVDNVKEINTLIKSKKFSEAEQKVKECQKNLFDLKTMVTSISDTGTDIVIEFTKKTAGTFAVYEILSNLYKSIDMLTMPYDSRNPYSYKKYIGHKDNLKFAALTSAYVMGKDKIKNKTWIKAKADLLKSISKQMVELKKIENKIKILVKAKRGC